MKHHDEKESEPDRQNTDELRKHQSTQGEQPYGNCRQAQQS